MYTIGRAALVRATYEADDATRCYPRLVKVFLALVEMPQLLPPPPQSSLQEQPEEEEGGSSIVTEGDDDDEEEDEEEEEEEQDPLTDIVTQALSPVGDGQANNNCAAILIAAPGDNLRRLVLAERRHNTRTVLDRLASISPVHADAVLKMELEVDRPGNVSELCLRPGLVAHRGMVTAFKASPPPPDGDANLHAAMKLITRLVAEEDGRDTAIGLLGQVLDYLYGEHPYEHPRRVSERRYNTSSSSFVGGKS
jgi:hypothetical protein